MCVIATYGFLLVLALFFMFPFYTMIDGLVHGAHRVELGYAYSMADTVHSDNYTALFTGQIGESTINSSYLRAMFNSFGAGRRSDDPGLVYHLTGGLCVCQATLSRQERCLSSSWSR